MKQQKKKKKIRKAQVKRVITLAVTILLVMTFAATMALSNLK
jgi:hypothetical protein